LTCHKLEVAAVIKLAHFYISKLIVSALYVLHFYHTDIKMNPRNFIVTSLWYMPTSNFDFFSIFAFF